MENQQNNLTNLNTPKQTNYNNTIYKYRFRYNLSDFTPARALALKENITFSKAIGIGLNYLRVNEKIEKINIKKIYSNHKPTTNKKENTTTIALTEKNYKYLQSKTRYEKYIILVKASYIAPIIYNKKNDETYKIEQKLMKKGKV